MAGDDRYSYIKNCVINQSYNRAIGLSGVNNLLIDNNVVYQATGNAIFTGYGTEKNNTITRNLLIDTRKSWVLQESDIKPASFYLNSPGNTLENNQAAGSDNYGYLFDLKENSEGPLFSLDICPVYAQFGVFNDNVAHSNLQGLSILTNYSPRTFQCLPL